ncbi:MAG TPA: pyridoxamine 5'-phosphate oxidase family protein [Acidimicrobiia bacterium]|jgi:nitroimidazol reductase NimA-like FMN-containing flavoprotein (pyridoxamine 5'-phosphate oxidase superfamily)
MQPLSREQALEVLEQAPVAHIGVISDGEPYVTPMSFVLIGDRIAFRSVPGRRMDAIRENPRVCVEVARFDPSNGEWASAIVMGRAHEIGDTPLRTEVVTRLLEKYRDAVGSPLSRGGLQALTGLTHVIVIEIEEVTGMTSGSGLGPRTRPGRL